MPELPEVETIARSLQTVLKGRQILSVEVLWPRIVDRPTPPEFCYYLTGATIEAVRRRGKYLVLPLDTGQTLLVHLRMSGRFALTSTQNVHQETTQHVHLRMKMDEGLCLLYVDPRKFGRFYLINDPNEVLGHLGPEPLNPNLRPEDLHAKFSTRRIAIKRLLLDQRAIAGLGNIYANEILWQARIHPGRETRTLSREEWERLWQAMRHVISESLRSGGTTLSDRHYVLPTGERGSFAAQLKVYGREGKACPRCGQIIKRIVQGQRSTYYCPACQIAPEGEAEDQLKHLIGQPGNVVFEHTDPSRSE